MTMIHCYATSNFFIIEIFKMYQSIGNSMMNAHVPITLVSTIVHSLPSFHLSLTPSSYTLFKPPY